MPIQSSYSYDLRCMEARKKAERQVRTKFPNLIEGSSGWGRAVANRRKRIK